jgi:hypothetical protein
VREVKTLKTLPSVKDGRLIVGGPSLTKPIERSKGFEFALISYHENIEALEQYEASKEHHQYGPILHYVSSLYNLLADYLRSVTSTYMFPFDEDLCRFDFEVDLKDEYMCAFGPLSYLEGKIAGHKTCIQGQVG